MGIFSGGEAAAACLRVVSAAWCVCCLVCCLVPVCVPVPAISLILSWFQVS